MEANNEFSVKTSTSVKVNRGAGKLRDSLKRFTARCKENRHLRLDVLFKWLNAKLRGYTTATMGGGRNVIEVAEAD